MSNKSEDRKLVKENREDVAKALEILFAKNYISRRRLYAENAIRGIFFGAGSIIGATILIGLLIWVLSWFDEIPLIGPLFDNAKQSIERGSSVR